MLSYLKSGVRNRIVDEIRKVSKRPALRETLSGIEAPEASPVDLALGRETVQRYRKALHELKPAERDAVIARVEMGCSYAEIASAGWQTVGGCSAG